jgi:HK97 gp10 family phage protein
MTGRWIGLKEANAALRRLPEHAQVRAQKTIDTTAFQFARTAERKAPHRTGLLAQSIVWKSRPRSLSAVVGITGDAFYWKFSEYGTVKQEAKPFWRPAAESLAGDHHARMMQALEQALRQVESEAR